MCICGDDVVVVEERVVDVVVREGGTVEVELTTGGAVDVVAGRAKVVVVVAPGMVVAVTHSRPPHASQQLGQLAAVPPRFMQLAAFRVIAHLVPLSLGMQHATRPAVGFAPRSPPSSGDAKSPHVDFVAHFTTALLHSLGRLPSFTLAAATPATHLTYCPWSVAAAQEHGSAAATRAAATATGSRQAARAVGAKQAASIIREQAALRLIEDVSAGRIVGTFPAQRELSPRSARLRGWRRYLSR